MGSATGFAITVIVNARVLGAPKYIPAHLDNGKFVDSRCDVNVRVNNSRGTDVNGEPGRKDDFTLTGWGEKAERLARHCSTGRAISPSCQPQSYSGRLFNKDGTLRLDAVGQVIMIKKYSFVVDQFPFGEESADFIRRQIETEDRPEHWNDETHPDYKAWRDHLKTRLSLMWDGKSEMFEYANVRMPQGQNIRVLTATETLTMRDNRWRGINSTPAQNTGGTVAYSPANLQTQVANTLGQPQQQAPKNWAPPAPKGAENVAKPVAKPMAANQAVDY